MTHLEQELQNLKNDTLEMIELVYLQLQKAQSSITSYDSLLFEDAKQIEKRIDAFELKLTMDCENALALFSPVAIDLRFILSIYKMVSSIERLGDYAYSIISIIEKKSNMFNADLLVKTQVIEMISKTSTMLEIINTAIEREDSTFARKTFLIDDDIDAINKESEQIIAEWISKHPENILEALYLLEIIKKLERFGDQVKNMTHEIIFYLEAKIIKHQKKLIKKEKDILKRKTND